MNLVTTPRMLITANHGTEQGVKQCSITWPYQLKCQNNGKLRRKKYLHKGNILQIRPVKSGNNRKELYSSASNGIFPVITGLLLFWPQCGML